MTGEVRSFAEAQARRVVVNLLRLGSIEAARQWIEEDCPVTDRSAAFDELDRRTGRTAS